MTEKQYLKMSDAFAHDSVEALEQHIYAGYMSMYACEYAAHAINSHDELVEQLDKATRALESAGYTQMSTANEWKPPIGPSASPLLQRIDQLLAERNATGVAIDNAMRGILPDKHSMLSRLKMIAGLSSARNALEARVNTIDECNDELVAEVERLHEFERDAMRYRFLCDNCTTQQADSCGPIFVMTIRQKNNQFNVGLLIDEAMNGSKTDE